MFPRKRRPGNKKITSHPRQFSTPYPQGKHEKIIHIFFWRGGKRTISQSKTCMGFFLTPDSRPNPRYLQKRVSGSQNPHFPSSWKWEFSVKRSPRFLQGNTYKMGILGPKASFSSVCKGDGKWGFWNPETLFSRKCGFGPLTSQSKTAMEPRLSITSDLSEENKKHPKTQHTRKRR